MTERDDRRARLKDWTEMNPFRPIAKLLAAELRASERDREALAEARGLLWDAVKYPKRAKRVGVFRDFLERTDPADTHEAPKPACPKEPDCDYDGLEAYQQLASEGKAVRPPDD